MNRHGTGYQETTSDSLNDTNLFVTSVLQRKSDIVLPIVTPRFAPSCDEQLLLGLGEIAKKYNVRYAKNRFFWNSEFWTFVIIFPLVGILVFRRSYFLTEYNLTYRSP